MPSRFAPDTLDAAFAADRSVSGLLNACREENEAVWRQAIARGGDHTMGTTLATVGMTSDAGMLVVHAGDLENSAKPIVSPGSCASLGRRPAPRRSPDGAC